MKFIKDNMGGTVQIPNAALVLCNLDQSPRFGLYALDGAAILVRERMTAPELVKAMESLNTLYEELYEYLKKACGQCDSCHQECPYQHFKPPPQPGGPVHGSAERNADGGGRL